MNDRAKRMKLAGYDPPDGILESLLWHMVENGFSHDLTNEKIDILIDLQTKLLQTIQQNNSRESIETFRLSQPKPSPKADKVRAWLADNPDTALTNVAIGRLLGVSHTLVNQVKAGNLAG